MSVGALAAFFAAIAALPLLPGLIELRRRRDAEPLPSDRGPARGALPTTGGAIELGPRARFERLSGFPVVTAGDPDPVPRLDPADRTIEDELVWAGDRLSLPGGARLDCDVVVRGDVRIGEGCVVVGSVKAHGSIEVLAGARIEGSLVAQRDVRVVGGAEIHGNVFAERDVELGPSTTVGVDGGCKTVLAGRRMALSPGVAVYGVLVAHCGGSVRSRSAR